MMDRWAAPIGALALILGAQLFCCEVPEGKQPTMAPTTPVSEVERTATPPSIEETYGELELVLLERHHKLDTKGPEFSEWLDLRAMAEPEEGIDVVFFLVRISNSGKRWLFPTLVGESVIDSKGREYSPWQYQFVVDEKADPMDPKNIVIQSNKGPVVLGMEERWVDILSVKRLPDKMGPGDSLVASYLFWIPQERATDRFLFEYTVCETAMWLASECQHSIAELALPTEATVVY